MNAGGDGAEILVCVAERGTVEDGEGGIGGDEDSASVAAFEAAHEEVVADMRDDEVSRGGGEGAVDDEDIAGADAIGDHGVAIGAQEEGRGGVGDQQPVEAERLFEVAGGRGGEADLAEGSVGHEDEGLKS